MNSLDTYKSIIKDFIDLKITADQFEFLYLDTFKKESSFFPEHIYEILNDLFIASDRYCGVKELQDDDTIDEIGLLDAAKYALAKLSIATKSRDS